MASKKAIFVLEGGAFFIGQSIGFEGETQGEIVFNTSMSGYQEILTDPSYKGQIVTMTYPLIGNYGCNFEDVDDYRQFSSQNVTRDEVILVILGDTRVTWGKVWILS